MLASASNASKPKRSDLINLYYFVQIVITNRRSPASLFRSGMNMYQRSRCPPEDRSLWAYPRTEQAGVPFPRSFSRVYARTCFIAPSLGHISVTPVLVNQRRMPTVSLDLSPPPHAPRDFFSGGSLLLSCAHKGHGSRAGAQNHGSTRERSDAHKLTRTRSCVHEPLRKSSLDRCRSPPVYFSPSLCLSIFSCCVMKFDICHRKMVVNISQWRKPS